MKVGRLIATFSGLAAFMVSSTANASEPIILKCSPAESIRSFPAIDWVYGVWKLEGESARLWLGKDIGWGPNECISKGGNSCLDRPTHLAVNRFMTRDWSLQMSIPKMNGNFIFAENKPGKDELWVEGGCKVTPDPSRSVK